jgi:tRNA dimethylallyltransferase
VRALAIVGPTASGKTALSLTLAERLGGEILSCDSMQIYRTMDIGTAKADDRERRRVRHHLLDLVDPGTPFSAADYAAEAERVLADVTSRGRLPIFCGGTGLYLKAVLEGRHSDIPGSDPALRERLTKEGTAPGGADRLWERLLALDPESALAIPRQNLRRVIRALEIYELTGRTKSELDAASREKPRLIDCFTVGLRFSDRSLLCRRIDERVDKMMTEGLLEEVKRLSDGGGLSPGSTAAQAIGYRQLLPHLSGEISLELAVGAVKTATRQYAKRQMTWFRSDPTVHWLDADENGRVRNAEELAEAVLPEIHAFLSQK